MAEKKYFGTDGIRGEANRAPMTVETATRLGRAVALTFSKEQHRARILVGKDTRLSGYMLEAALLSGITSTGADVILLGPLPTPGIAYLTPSMRADAGIVISASHNPFYDNGLKVFGRDGFKLPDSIEHELEELMEKDQHSLPLANGANVGRAKRIEDATGRYVTHLKTLLRSEFDLEDIKIVVDCAHGAAYKVAPTLFRELGADVTTMGVSPNGTNINDGVGSLYPEQVAKRVVETGADIGIALDGDADRVILIDDKGHIIDGDAVLGICAVAMNKQGTLRGHTVVATVMSNMGLDHMLATEGISLLRTQVGDRYVVEKMRAGNYNFGGEQSGHLVFLDHATTGDGLVASLQVLNLMLSQDQPLSQLSRCFEKVPQLLVSKYVESKPPLEQLPMVQSAIQGVEQKLGTEGRVVVRYSGTEAKVRVMVEATNQDHTRAGCDSILSAFQDEVGLVE